MARTLRTGGVIVWNVADSVIKGSESLSSFKQAIFFKERCGLSVHDTMIWKKTNMPFPDRSRYTNYFEYMFIISKGKPKTVNLIADKPNKRSGEIFHGTQRISSGETIPHHNSSTKKKSIKELGVRPNVWEIPNPGLKGTVHPATFPVARKSGLRLCYNCEH